MPVTLRKQDVPHLEHAALAISIEQRDLSLGQRGENLMMAAAACEQATDLPRGVVAHDAVPDERARDASWVKLPSDYSKVCETKPDACCLCERNALVGSICFNAVSSEDSLPQCRRILCSRFFVRSA
jgi:hypothetical protein